MPSRADPASDCTPALAGNSLEDIMRRPSRLLLTLAAAISALVLIPSAADAGPTGGPGPAGGPPKGELLKSGLVGSTAPNEGGVTLFGVVPGGRTWVIRAGEVRVARDGRLDVRMDGLVIPEAPFDGTNPVAAVSATLVCNGVPGTPTATFSLSPKGDGRIRTDVTVPQPCLAPAVLVNPNGSPTTYIAANG
jgi:hypothetical protein